MKRRTRIQGYRKSAHGFVVLLIILAILTIGGVSLLVILGARAASSDRQIQQAIEDNKTLMAAKAALLGYVVQTTDGGSGFRLGNLPTPDILNKLPVGAKGTQIEYDGYSDGDFETAGANKCLSTNLNGLPGVSPGTSSLQPTQRCLGKFPWRTLNLDVGNPSANDPLGQVPWLAISANLNARDSCLGSLNSDTLNWIWAAPSATCPAAANKLPYPWMTVMDQFGSVLSNRVAAVLIMPGSPIQTGNRNQSRTQTNPGFASDYLDAISLPLGCSTTCTATFDNAALSNTFIQIPAGVRYPSAAEDVALRGQLLKFNDVLIYITIDELMSYIERRVLSEMSAAVKTSKAKTGTYPWAAAFPATAPADYSAFGSAPGKSFGLFPFLTSNVAYQTDFDWQIYSVPTLPKECVLVQASPNRYIDAHENLRADFYSIASGTLDNSGGATGAASRCFWKEIPTTGNADFDCEYANTITLPNKSFMVYTDSACTSVTATGSPATYGVARTLSVTIGGNLCSVANLAVSFQPADAANPQRYSRECSNAISSSSFLITAKDLITIPVPPSTQEGNLSVSGKSKRVALRNVRYQPVMPKWFYDNNWYLSAFYSVSPSKAPSPISPCGSISQLTSGNAPADAVVILAGSRLPVLTPTQTRPSASASDYLEAPNLMGGTTCNFASSSSNVTGSSNDQVLVVAP
jgi:hypothetical protein